MKYFTSTRKNEGILGLILLALAGFFAGCTTRAETTGPADPPASKREAPATTQTPGETIVLDPYTERQYEGDFEYSTPTAEKKSPALTKAAFDRIKTGMTLAEVERLLGDKGMLVSTMDVNGRKTKIYKWSTDDFSSYIDVTVENEKVIAKKDKNLK